MTDGATEGEPSVSAAAAAGAGAGPGGGRLTGLAARWLERYRPPEAALFYAMAAVVGGGAGLAAIALRALIEAVATVGYQLMPELTASFGAAYLVIVPAVGGLAVGLLVYHFAREAKGHGVPEVMEAVARRGGRIRPVVVIVKSLASAICIGSGGSVGREGPIVQIGSGIGSLVGQKLGMAPWRVRNLVACGAAAGIAATFNAPIAGVFFALEVILDELSVTSVGSVVIASVTASVVGRLAFGDVPAFVIPAYALHSFWELPLYAVLGVLAALVAVGYTRALYWAEDRFEALRVIPEWLQPALGGALLGVLALLYSNVPGLGFATVPHVFGVGYPTIEGVFAGHFGLLVLVALVLLKIAATSITLGSGGSGGVFAPSLFIGAALGGAFALVAQQLLPGVMGANGGYVLVAMAAVFAGATHAPITAVITLFELTGDYRIILPLMLAVVVSSALAHRLLRGDSIYTIKLARRGIDLRMTRREALHEVRVGEVASTEVVTIRPDQSLAELERAFDTTRRHGFPVVDGSGRLVGIVTVRDLRGALRTGTIEATPVARIMTSAADGGLVTAWPDESMASAVERMSSNGIGRMPVVRPEDPQRLVALLRRDDVIRAYRLALSRSAGPRY